MLSIKLEHDGREIWLESNTHNYIIHDGYNTRINKKGEEVKDQKHPCYYSRLDLALECILTKGIRRSDANTLEKMYNEIIELKRLILNKVSL